MPPSIAIATPALGGPGTMRVVLNSSIIQTPVLGGPGSSARAARGVVLNINGAG